MSANTPKPSREYRQRINLDGFSEDNALVIQGMIDGEFNAAEEPCAPGIWHDNAGDIWIVSQGGGLYPVLDEVLDAGRGITPDLSRRARDEFDAEDRDATMELIANRAPFTLYTLRLIEAEGVSDEGLCYSAHSIYNHTAQPDESGDEDEGE